MAIQFKLIPIESLNRGRYQPRQDFNEEGLEELAQSIRSQGLIEPLIVRTLSDGFEIIAGERRWRASMKAGLTELPCLVGDYTDQQAAAIALIENIQRQNLNLIEEAAGYQQLIETFHFQQEDIAALTGKSRSHIANILRLLSLCSYAQEKIRANQLSLGHARMLVSLPPSVQEVFTQAIIEKNWSVRRLELEVRNLKQKEIKDESSSPNIEHLQQCLAEQLGAPVQFDIHAMQGGWLKIKFFDNGTLAGLLERMGLRYD